MSITGLGSSYKTQALSGLRDLSQMEQQRDAANKQMESADSASKMSTTFTGAGLGAAVGLMSGSPLASLGMAAGPVGALAGAAAGYLFSSLF